MGCDTGQFGKYVPLVIPLWNSSQPSSFCRATVSPAPPFPTSRYLSITLLRGLFFYPDKSSSRFPQNVVTPYQTVWRHNPGYSKRTPHLTPLLYSYRNLHKIIPCWKKNAFKRFITIPHLETSPSSRVHTALVLMLLMNWRLKVLTSGGLQRLAVAPSFTNIRHLLSIKLTFVTESGDTSTERQTDTQMHLTVAIPKKFTCPSTPQI